MPRSHKRHTSKIKQLNQVAFLSLIDDLDSDLEFYSAIILELMEVRHVFLNDSIQNHSLIHGFTLSPTTDPLQVIKSQLGRYGTTQLSPSALHLQDLLRTQSVNQQYTYRHRQHVSSQLGLNLKILSDIPIHRLKYRPETKEYPPRNHFVLENPDEPIPPPPKLKDRTCNYCSNFHILDISQLSFILSSYQSIIFIDDDIEEIMTIVIRDLAKDYFSEIGEWGINLIQDSIKRRSHFCQRNNPGTLARVGVSEGARQSRLFGWVRNLKEKFKTASDKIDHDQSISSLFGIFYTLLRSQISWVIEKFENVISSTHLSRLDPNQLFQFTIPLQ